MSLAKRVFIKISPKLKELLDQLPNDSAYLMREALYRAINMLDKETREIRSLKEEGMTIYYQVCLLDPEVYTLVHAIHVRGKSIGRRIRQKLTLLTNEIAEKLIKETLEMRGNAREKLRRIYDETTKGQNIKREPQSPRRLKEIKLEEIKLEVKQ